MSVTLAASCGAPGEEDATITGVATDITITATGASHDETAGGSGFPGDPLTFLIEETTRFTLFRGVDGCENNDLNSVGAALSVAMRDHRWSGEYLQNGQGTPYDFMDPALAGGSPSGQEGSADDGPFPVHSREAFIGIGQSKRGLAKNSPVVYTPGQTAPEVVNRHFKARMRPGIGLDEEIPASVDEDEMLCDDGSSVVDSEDTPNWACMRDGCSPHDRVCWDERLTYCYGEGGKDLGVCVLAREDCSSRLACFDLWLYCAGEYKCLESGVIGCTRGTCTTDEASTRHESLKQP